MPVIVARSAATSPPGIHAVLVVLGARPSARPCPTLSTAGFIPRHGGSQRLGARTTAMIVTSQLGTDEGLASRPGPSAEVDPGIALRKAGLIPGSTSGRVAALVVAGRRWL